MVAQPIELPGFETEAPDRARWKKHSADFTPRPVVRQGMEFLRDRLRLQPGAILDPSAGAGVFGQVFREVWPSAKTTAIEPRAEEEPYLRRNYDAFAIDTFDGVIGGPPVDEPFDLVAGNYPFNDPKRGPLLREFVELGLECTRPGGWLVYLGTNEQGTRVETSRDVWRDYPPTLQLRIASQLFFRGPGEQADFRSYSWWCWQRHERAPDVRCEGWRTIDLPLLPTADRKWVVRPGTDEA